MMKARAEYEAISAPTSLRSKVNNAFKDRRREQRLRSILAIAAVLFLCLTALNVSPAIAYATEDVPVLGTLVRVLTFNRFTSHTQGYHLEITTPVLEGLLDEKLQAELNARFKEDSANLISGFEEGVRQLKEQFGEEIVHFGFVSDYTLRTETEYILAVELYTYSTVGTWSSNSFVTIDRRYGELLSLQGLFQEGADYRAIISSYITEEMRRLNAEENGMFFIAGETVFEGFSLIDEEQNFYINAEDQLVICFNKHEVAAGAQGAPEFTIPLAIIEDILAVDFLK